MADEEAERAAYALEQHAVRMDEAARMFPEDPKFREAASEARLKAKALREEARRG